MIGKSRDRVAAQVKNALSTFPKQIASSKPEKWYFLETVADGLKNWFFMRGQCSRDY